MLAYQQYLFDQHEQPFLKFCAKLIQDEAVIFFDDWHGGGLAARGMGEKRAFDEFLSENPQFIAKPLDTYDPVSQVFLVLAR